MITQNQNYLDCIDNLNGMNYLLNTIAVNTNGDAPLYQQEGLFFLSFSMDKEIKKLKQQVESHEKKKLSTGKQNKKTIYNIA